jgi:hypothetical protein
VDSGDSSTLHLELPILHNWAKKIKHGILLKKFKKCDGLNQDHYGRIFWKDLEQILRVIKICENLIVIKSIESIPKDLI